MDKESKKLIFMIIGILAVVFIIGIAFRTPAPDKVMPDILTDEGDITVRGQVVCLPHRDTTGPQTLECALGLQADDGRYFGLREADGNIVPQVINAQMNTPVEVAGKFTSFLDTKYQSVGVIDVESLTSLSTTTAPTPDIVEPQ